MTKTKEAAIRYFAYLRKSSEDKERQAISIPAQKEQVLKAFPGFDVEFIVEERSAFKPFNRPAFSEMLERISKGERRGLLAWQPDRLSRNEIDAGNITYMLRDGNLKELRFCVYHFENNPAGIWMLQMALSQSQYESAKKGQDVKRGTSMKARNGDYPSSAPLGYLNEKFAERGKKRILVDPERFDLVRKMWDLMLTGKYTVPQIWKIAGEEWGLRAHARGGKSNGNKPLPRSLVYLTFIRPFYYGEYEFPLGSGNWCKGNHVAMVTKDEFDRVQFLLGRADRPRPKTHEFAYRGHMRCGVCGAAITAERKYKKLASGEVRSYIFYHCTHHKDYVCTQGSIEEKVLEAQVMSSLVDYSVPPEFKAWALDALREMDKEEGQETKAVSENQKKALADCVRRMDALVNMRMNDEIPEDVFRAKSAALKADKQRMEAEMAASDDGAGDWLAVAERGFNFAERALIAFEKDDSDDRKARRSILANLGSNHEVIDKMLRVNADILLERISKVSSAVEEEKGTLEPTNDGLTKEDYAVIAHENPRLLRVRDSNPNTILQRDVSYH